MRILFRTSGGRAPKKELGFGHIYRCINLAGNFNAHEIHFLVEDYGDAKKVFFDHGFRNIHLLKKGISLEADVKKTNFLLKKKNIDILIIDRYKLKTKYVKKISRSAKVVVISDLRNIDYPVDLVINGFIGYSNQIKKNKYGTHCLLGPAYQILNKKFARGPSKKRNNILLATFGGYDEGNIIDNLLYSVKNSPDDIMVRIILGPGTIKSDNITSYEKNYGKKIKIIQKTNSMYKEMKQVSYGICSGGITTYEFASMKIPFAIICQVKHQLLTAKEWQKRGLAYNLGLIDSKTQKKINNFLRKIKENKIEYRKNESIIDGNGSKRAAQEILKLV